MIEALHSDETGQSSIDQIRKQLTEYGESSGLHGLEGRVNRGLDPAAMWAIPAFRKKLHALAEAYGANLDDAERLTQDLHKGGVWRYAKELSEGSPEATVWIVAGEATVRGKEDMGDLTEQQLNDDIQRITELLDRATEDPEGFAETARRNLIERAKSQFQLDDGVPFSDTPEGFLAMAVSGHKSGVVVDSEGLLFVGADSLGFSEVARKRGLNEIIQEDRGREATFLVNSNGQRRIKKLYPGFGIVFEQDTELAKDLARTAL